MNKKLSPWVPLSETAYYIILSLDVPKHGYGIIKHVSNLTNNRIKLGSGTIYTTLGKMKKAHLIDVLLDKDRKTIYELTNLGIELRNIEIERIKKIYFDTLKQEELYSEKG